MNESMVEKVKKILEGIVAGKPVYESCGITPDEVEAVYSLGYTYYQVGRLEDAETLFRFVTVMDGFDTKYGYALASTLQAEHKFADAAELYGTLVPIDSTNPAIYSGLAECRVALGDKKGAQAAFEALVKAVKPDTPERKAAVERAERMIEGLKS